MTVRYLDLDKSGGSADGTSWVAAFETFILAVAGMAAGDTCYVQGTTAGGDTINIAVPGTKDNPSIWIGVDAATTATPPDAANVVQDRTDAMPKITVTGTLDITIGGFGYFWGMHFDSPDNFNLANNPALDSGLIFEECILECTDNFGMGDEQADHYVKWRNCTYNRVDSGTLLFFQGVVFEWEGGETGGAVTSGSIFSGGAPGSNSSIAIRGVDFSDAAGSTVVSPVTLDAARFEFLNNEMGASFVLTTRASFTGWGTRVTTQMSVDGVDVAADIVTQRRESLHGLVETELTVTRSGTLSDGTTSFSQKMTVDDNKTYEGKVGLQSFPIYGWLNQTTNPTTVTAYIHNETADFDDDEVWAELFYPGNDSSQYKKVDSKPIPLATIAAITDDTSSWGASGDTFSQKIEFTLTDIDHIGPIYAYVYLAQDATSVPPLYVDNQLYVS